MALWPGSILQTGKVHRFPFYLARYPTAPAGYVTPESARRREAPGLPSSIIVFYPEPVPLSRRDHDYISSNRITPLEFSNLFIGLWQPVRAFFGRFQRAFCNPFLDPTTMLDILIVRWKADFSCSCGGTAGEIVKGRPGDVRLSFGGVFY